MEGFGASDWHDQLYFRQGTLRRWEDPCGDTSEGSVTPLGLSWSGLDRRGAGKGKCRDSQAWLCPKGSAPGETVLKPSLGLSLQHKEKCFPPSSSLNHQHLLCLRPHALEVGCLQTPKAIPNLQTEGEREIYFFYYET